MYEMNTILGLIVPTIFFLSFAFAACRKVRIYDSFTQGMKGAIPLIVSIFPYIAAVTMFSKLLEVSGLGDKLAALLFPLFRLSGVPEELAPLILIKPLSGSGSIAVISDILEIYGVDSYIARCACVLYGSSETVFYIGAVYFAGLKRKRLHVAFAIALFSYLLSVILACALCRVL